MPHRSRPLAAALVLTLVTAFILRPLVHAAPLALATDTPAASDTATAAATDTPAASDTPAPSDTPLATPTAAATATPPWQIQITLPASGATVLIERRFTYGDEAIFFAVLGLTAVVALRWVYDVARATGAGRAD